MTERIEKLTELTLSGQMFVDPVKTEFDRTDLFLDKTEREVKRLCEFILNQEPKLTEYSAMTGFFRCDGSVVGDAFNRPGHKETAALMSAFYLKPIENLSTCEWQHATADYHRVLNIGLEGIIGIAEESMKTHKSPEETAFLRGEIKVMRTLIAWAHKCSARALALSEKTENAEYRKNLERLSAALLHVPEHKPRDFYEAVLTVYLCYSADPDSIGTPDRYLLPFYRDGIKNGTLTREKAKEYLQELFLMLQAKTRPDQNIFTRGGESHFCIGGYLPDGKDGFNELSALIVESLLELPTYAPQITLRWTKKLKHEVFRFMMDCERRDPMKRIAFTNDEKRIQCYTEICGFPYERAVAYTTVGCNEPAFEGAISGSNSHGNILHCVETLFHRKADETKKVESYEEFYKLFKKELSEDLERIFDYDNKYNEVRARDVNYLSVPFFKDCLEHAKSMTQGGGNYAIASPELIGITNVIDSLCVVKQFVFEEKTVGMEELIDALQKNWVGYEDLRQRILKTACFFGNDDDLSNGVAKNLYHTFYELLNGKKNLFGYPWLVGDLLGYNEHHKWFGEYTKATPDGRAAGDMLKFGIGQSEGKDREGLTALLNAVAGADPTGIACGNTVTNISLDEALIKNDANFEKTVDLFETYFQNGGVHFQLNYVSREELLAAKITPENYKNLRVRVSGFSDYFVRLTESLQDDIIERTGHEG